MDVDAEGRIQEGAMTQDDRLSAIQDAIGGSQGIQVRIAVAEHELAAISQQIGDLRVQLHEHRQVSNKAHSDALSEIRAMRSESIRLDYSTAKWVGIVVATIASLLGVGGVAATRASSPIEVEPPRASATPPAAAQ
jgi:hypothetical protein